MGVTVRFSDGETKTFDRAVSFARGWLEWSEYGIAIPMVQLADDKGGKIAEFQQKELSGVWIDAGGVTPAGTGVETVSTKPR